MYVYIYNCAPWVPLAQTLDLPSSCPLIPVSLVVGSCSESLCCTPAPVRDANMNQHTDTQTLWIPLVTWIPRTVRSSTGPGSLLFPCLSCRWAVTETDIQTHMCLSADPWARMVLISPTVFWVPLPALLFCAPLWVGRWVFYHINNLFSKIASFFFFLAINLPFHFFL